MPGLVGVVSTMGQMVNLDLMEAMRDAIRHRDWYHVDDYVSPKGTVAVSRVHLGIINGGIQPFSARNGKVKVFLHGEIYDDQSLHSDPLRLIYQLYEEKGMDLASCLNGSFVLVIVDEEEEKVLIANDRIATKPLFFFNDGQAIYFGPEMKSLFLTPTLKRKLNLGAIADFLTNGQFTREHTLIEGLKTVDGATVLKVTANGVTWHKYWEHPFKYGYHQSDEVQSQRYYQDELDEVLRKAISRRLRTDNTYGVLLSGGWDSRGILGYYLEQKNDKELHTISWGREEDIPNSDCAVAKRLAHKVGANHCFYKLTAEEVFDNLYDFVLLGEGLTWFPESYEVFHRIRERQGVDIVLRGDEWLGSQADLVHDEHTMFRKLSLRALRNIREYQRVLKPYYYQRFCELDAETISYVSSRCKATNIRDRKDFFYVDILLKYYLNPLNYVKNFSLESFTPLLDYDVMDFVSTLPIQYRLDKILFRRTVLENFPELFEQGAQTHNMIDWAASFRGSPELKRIVYRELIEVQNEFSEFIDIDGLRSVLDAFFAFPSNPSVKTRAKAGALNLLRTSKATYNLVHKHIYNFRRQRETVWDRLPIEGLILRLLVLKVWGNIFLEYPVVDTSV